MSKTSQDKHDLSGSAKPWWKTNWVRVPLLIVILVICQFTIPRFPFGPYALYGDMTPQERAAKPPIAVLADEESHPFMYGHRPLKTEWLNSIPKWPDVRSCLVRSERHKDLPDLRLINWDAFRDSADAEVCLWRIFSSLGDPELAADWIRFHGLRTKGLKAGTTSVDPGRYKWYPDEVLRLGKGRTKIDILAINGSRSSRWTWSLVPSTGPFAALSMFLTWGEHVSAQWTADGKLLRVQHGHTIL